MSRLILSDVIDASLLAQRDPGAYTPRGDDFKEPLHQWEARAMQIATAPLYARYDEETKQLCEAARAEEVAALKRQLSAANEAREKAEKDFRMYRGMFTRIKDQIIAGHGPEEMFRWQETLREHDKGDGRVDAVAALIGYFYKLCAAKEKVTKERDSLAEQLAALP